MATDAPDKPKITRSNLCRAKAGGPQPAGREGALLAPEPTPAPEQHSLDTPVIIVPSDSSWAGGRLAYRQTPTQ